MTFSDAEDEHHGTDNASQDHDRSPSRSRTESGVSNASTASLASPSSSTQPHANNNQAVDDVASPRPSSNAPSTSSAAAATDAAAANPGASNVDIANAVNSMVGVNMTGVDSKKIMEKLQQVQGYIQQTTTAMTALEQQGDISKVGQYNTLAKILRDLRDSEAKLKEHLETAKKNEAAAAAAQMTNGSSTQPATAQVNGREESQSESSGRGHVIGVVGSANVRSLQDRLAASQVESVALMSQMRESIARREDLMTRYKATRERLANLKKQRLGMQEEKQRLLDAAAGRSTGSVDDEVEDPIPGAANWSLTDINQGLVDFQGLLDKVENLTQIYTQKAEEADPNDAEEQASINGKLRQLAIKRRQLTGALAKLRDCQRQKQQEQGQSDVSEGDSQTPSTTPGQTPDASHEPPERSPRDAGGVASGSDGGGAAPEGTSNSIESGNPTLASLGGAMSSLASASEDLTTRQNQLVSLQQQLSEMKRLLDITSSAQRQAEARAQESKRRLDEAKSQQGNLTLNNTESGEQEGAQALRIGEEVVGLSGRRIILSEEERRNPEIASKYQQLADAKKRLAKMEEVIEMISAAKRSGQNLRDVMPSEYLAILEDAEAEMGMPSSDVRRSQPTSEQPTPDQAEEEDDNRRVSRRQPRGPRMGSIGRGERERERRAREQERSEISAMQKRLNKATPRVPPINEGSRHGHEKGAIKKQPQALWQDGSHNKNASSRGGAAGVDPRVSEVLAMHEEVRQKKNALEALMRRMGKSSSLNADNISDNISEGSDRLREEDEEVVGGMGATWGGSGMHDYSDDQYRQSSDDDLIEEEDDSGDLLARGPPRRPPQPHHIPPKDRNRHPASRHRRSRQDSGGRFSVNNLSGSNYGTTGRTKHNRLRASGPKAVWEPVESSYKSPSNTTLQAQHSINTALSQLSQVQGTINNLQESLRQEQSQVLGGGGSHYPSYAAPPPLLLPAADLSTPTPTAPLPHLSTQALTPMSSYAGLGSLAMPAQVSGGDSGREMSQQVLSGLQQCFSQLHLHSLEIQALSKHLQVRRPYSLYYPLPTSAIPPPYGFFPPYQ